VRLISVESFLSHRFNVNLYPKCGTVTLKNNDDYQKLIEIITDSYYYNLQIKNKNWKNDWEILCSKESKENLEKLKKIKDGKQYELICKDIIKKYIIDNQRSYPVSRDFKDIVLDYGIFVDHCTYTGVPLDIISGNLFLKNKYNFLGTLLSDNFMENDKVRDYYDSMGISEGYKMEFLNFTIIWLYHKLFFPTNFDETINQHLNDKKIKFIIMSLSIELSNGSHANILIWDKEKNIISRFEPHGNSNPPQLNYNESLLDDLLRNKLTCFDNTLTYLSPKDFLPNIGFQKLEMEENQTCWRVGDPNGFCAIWCIWWVDMRLKYKEIDQKVLVIKLIKKIREEGMSFKNLIRNYTKNVTDLRDKILKKTKIDINDWYNDKYTDEQADLIIYEIKKMI